MGSYVLRLLLILFIIYCSEWEAEDQCVQPLGRVAVEQREKCMLSHSLLHQEYLCGPVGVLLFLSYLMVPSGWGEEGELSSSSQHTSVI